MNKSIYQISDELQAIINEIEENGGEITEDIEQKLAISQDELESKIDSYCNVIASVNSNIDFCKKEKQRINDLQNVKKNLVDNLKKRVLEAVEKFGYDGKSGNKIIDTQTHKIFTKNSQVVIVDRERYNILCAEAINYVSELNTNGILELNDDDVDLSGMLAAINSIIGSGQGETFVPFTISDLCSCRYTMEFSVNILDLMRHPNILEVLRTFQTYVPEEDSTLLKNSLLADKETGKSNFTIAQLSTNTSLTIK